MPPDEDSVNLSELSKAWEVHWPDCRPISYEIRGMRKRWVRFHGLPDSKRFAESDEDYEEILRRDHAVLSDLSDRNRVEGNDVVVVTYSWSSSPNPDVADGSRRGRHWVSLPVDPDEKDDWVHLNASMSRWRGGELDPLLRRVADDEERVLIMPVDLRWLFAPYDGGMDVVVATSTFRDELKSAHSEWLSAHSLGL